MSFANEFRRALKTLDEEIAYYRSFAHLDGMAEPIEVLTDLREKWHECRARSEARGKLPAEPEDWSEDAEERRAAKEIMNKAIKAAALAAAALAAAASTDASVPSE
jgi:hypothetical protein